MSRTVTDRREINSAAEETRATSKRKERQTHYNLSDSVMEVEPFSHDSHINEDDFIYHRVQRRIFPLFASQRVQPHEGQIAYRLCGFG